MHSDYSNSWLLDDNYDWETNLQYFDSGLSLTGIEWYYLHLNETYVVHTLSKKHAFRLVLQC